MAVTKEQAYTVVLNSLNSAWTAISRSADDWAKHPKMAGATATTPVQTAINTAVRSIREIEKQLLRGSTERSIVEDIGTRLEAFKNVLVKGGLLNATELVEQWKNSVEKIMDDILEKAPEAGRMLLFKALAKKLAA